MLNIKSYDDFLLESLILEATQKDIMRVNDIVKKSVGSELKMVQLATTMCKLITDKNKAYDRGVAAEQILGKDHPVTKTFFDRALALGMDVAKTATVEKVLPGSKRPSSEQYKTTREPRSGGCPILPCGKLNLKTGKNKYFNIKDSYQINSTLEVYKVIDFRISEDKYKIVMTSGSTPIYQIGTKVRFIHDQNHRDLFYGEMVDYIESAHSEELIPLYGGSISMYVYK